jgi:two-component system, chemotaxis family, chemotaxis protein CheY
MPKRVLDVGQCGPDHATIHRYLTRHFDCEVVQVDDASDALTQLKGSRFDLVLVNRKLDVDYSDGVEVIRQIKSDPATANVPAMLVTNYPEHQDAAVAAGAVRGFGKLEFDNPETRERIAAVLDCKTGDRSNSSA